MTVSCPKATVSKNVTKSGNFSSYPDHIESLASACTVGTGVSQGCFIFTIIVFISWSDNTEVGTTVGGRIVNRIRYADDKTVVVNSQKRLQLMAKLNEIAKDICFE